MVSQEELRELIQRYRDRGGYVRLQVESNLIIGIKLRRHVACKYTPWMPVIFAAERMREANCQPLIFQIHHQDSTSLKSKMVAKCYFGDEYATQDFISWCRDVAESHPLPVGNQWLVCNERSEKFAMGVNYDR